jgi:hypothetical protein
MRFAILLTALLVFAVHTAPCRACINDREVGKAEKEFKSQYTPTKSLLSQEKTDEPLFSSPEKWVPFSALIVGGGLLSASFLVIGLRGLRSRP